MSQNGKSIWFTPTGNNGCLWLAVLVALIILAIAIFWE